MNFYILLNQPPSAFVESTVNQVISKRMVKKQQMQRHP